jgi:hypothetical protein
MQVLNLPDFLATDLGNDVELLSVSMKTQHHYERVANKILGNASLLLKGLEQDDGNTRYEDLLSMVRDAGDFAAQLWAQRAQMSSVFDDGGQSAAFQINSEMFKAIPSCAWTATAMNSMVVS